MEKINQMKQLPNEFFENDENEGANIVSLALAVNDLIDCVRELQQEVEKLNRFVSPESIAEAHINYVAKLAAASYLKLKDKRPKSDSACEHHPYETSAIRLSACLNCSRKEDKTQECKDCQHASKITYGQLTLCPRHAIANAINKPASGEHCQCEPCKAGKHAWCSFNCDDSQRLDWKEQQS